MNVLASVVAGPVGWVIVLAAIGVLIATEVVRESRPVTLTRPHLPGSVLAICAGVVAFAVLAVRFTGFS